MLQMGLVLRSTWQQMIMQNNYNGWVAAVDSKIYNMMQAWGSHLKILIMQAGLLIWTHCSKPVHLELLRV